MGYRCNAAVDVMLKLAAGFYLRWGWALSCHLTKLRYRAEGVRRFQQRGPLAPHRRCLRVVLGAPQGVSAAQV